MTPEQMKEKAVELFMKRFHCSQAVLAAGQEKLGAENQEVVKAMGAFGGGIASAGRTCGALVGGIALISSLYSRGNLDEKEDVRMWHVSRKFSKLFDELTAQYGGHNCRDIARIDWYDNSEVKDFYKNPESRRKICAEVVGETARMLGQLLEEEAQEKK